MITITTDGDSTVIKIGDATEDIVFCSCSEKGPCQTHVNLWRAWRLEQAARKDSVFMKLLSQYENSRKDFIIFRKRFNEIAPEVEPRYLTDLRVTLEEFRGEYFGVD